MSNRPAVPAALKRQLLIEAGYRCAVPTCRAPTPLDFEHIKEWVATREHRFEDMIVLCANCHARKTRGEIPGSAIQSYKNNLAIINGRYTPFEARVLEDAAEFLRKNPTGSWEIKIDEASALHVKGIVQDGYVSAEVIPMNMFRITGKGGRSLVMQPCFLTLTDKGKEWVSRWNSGTDME